MSGNTGRQSTTAVTRVARLLKILHSVRTRRPGEQVGRDELARECSCSQRTIQRDIELLQFEAQVPIDYDPASRSYVLPDKDWAFPHIQLTLEDVMGLALARGLLTGPHIPHSEEIRTALEKAIVGLSPALQSLLAEAAGVIHIGTSPRDYADSPISQLMQAAMDTQSIEILYTSRSRGEQAWRRVDPYSVEQRDGRYWELHGWCHRRNAVRTFALDQISEVRSTGERFVANTAEWAAFVTSKGIVGGLRGGSETVVQVRFDPTVAAYARDQRWPDPLALELLPDGSVLLSGTVQGTDGIIAELLRWRRHAEVIGGPELRARMMEEIQAMSSLYKGN